MSSVLPADREAYEARRAKTQEYMAGMGKGANQTASYDLRLNATTISRVVRGIEINEPVLEQVAEWAEKRAQGTSSALLTA